MAKFTLNSFERSYLISLMNTHGGWDSETTRRNFFSDTYGDTLPNLEFQVAISGTTNEFSKSLVKELERQGSLPKNRRHSFIPLLRYLHKKSSGWDQELAFIEEILDRLDEWSQQQASSFFINETAEINHTYTSGKINFAFARTFFAIVFLLLIVGYIVWHITQIFINSEHTTSNMLDTGRIIFTSGREGNNEIYSISPDGKQLIRHTTDISDDRWAIFSPDRNTILFQSDRNGRNSVYIMNADGANIQSFIKDVGEHAFPTWSPSGELVAYHRTIGGFSQIFLTDKLGHTHWQLLHHDANFLFPSWSSDGKSLIFICDVNGNWDIFSMNVDGSNLTQITYTTSHEWFPKWSPDQSKISFTSYRDGNWEVYVMDVKDAENEDEWIRITQNPADDGSATWSPDGEWIAFESRVDGNMEIFISRWDGSNSTRLTSNQSDDLAPIWSTK